MPDIGVDAGVHPEAGSREILIFGNGLVHQLIFLQQGFGLVQIQTLSKKGKGFELVSGIA